MEMIGFWNVVPFTLVDIDRRFTRAHSLHHRGDECETSADIYQTTRCYVPEYIFSIELVTHFHYEKLPTLQTC